MFLFAAVRRGSPFRTFNPKVAGSIPARPIRNSRSCRPEETRIGATPLCRAPSQVPGRSRVGSDRVKQSIMTCSPTFKTTRMLNNYIERSTPPAH